MERESQDEAELIEAKAEADFKGRVFAADLHNQLRMFKALFEEPEEPEVEEFVPESERDLEKMMMEVRKMGLELAD